jgi:hypothetical protein
VAEDSKKTESAKKRAYRLAYYQKNREALCAKRRSLYHAHKNNSTFVENKCARAKRHYQNHKEREAARNLAYRLAHPELKEKKWIRRALDPERTRQQQILYNERQAQERYNLTARAKPNICDICGGNRGRIVFDHCHQRGHFRGWLCDRCNTTLGHVEDDVSLLMKMAAYLLRTREGQSPQLSIPGI